MRERQRERERERVQKRRRERESPLFFETTYEERIRKDFNQDCFNRIYNDYKDLIQKHPDGIMTDIDVYESIYEW